jgi:hypothetical protein
MVGGMLGAYTHHYARKKAIGIIAPLYPEEGVRMA